MRSPDAGSNEDGYLISRFKAGEEEAFDRLMTIYMDKVYAVAWGVLRNREDAKDAAQEVFIKFHRSLAKFTPKDNIGAWLYRVCINHCIDRKRRVKSGASEMTPEDWEYLRGSEIDEPEYRAYQSETGRLIKAAVEKLPERQRYAFILRHYNLLSINEIACALGCTEGAVKAHLSRATAHLRDALRGTVVFETREVDRDAM